MFTVEMTGAELELIALLSYRYETSRHRLAVELGPNRKSLFEAIAPAVFPDRKARDWLQVAKDSAHPDHGPRISSSPQPGT